MRCVAADRAHLRSREREQVLAGVAIPPTRDAPGRRGDEAHDRQRRDPLAAARLADHPERRARRGTRTTAVDRANGAVLGAEPVTRSRISSSGFTGAKITPVPIGATAARRPTRSRSTATSPPPRASATRSPPPRAGCATALYANAATSERRIVCSVARARPSAIGNAASPPRNSVTSAAAAATSAPEPSAMPRSAAASAGASLRPSPIIATTWPPACSAATSAALTVGRTAACTRVMPSASAIAVAAPAGRR